MYEAVRGVSFTVEDGRASTTSLGLERAADDDTGDFWKAFRSVTPATFVVPGTIRATRSSGRCCGSRSGWCLQDISSSLP